MISLPEIRPALRNGPSCVIMQIVAHSLRSLISKRILPVGSSASKIDGRAPNLRATATRY
jgi:hypothetical protein